ncbi:MAG: major capsid protein [Microviridae sp.]|nr:MAG: major capsid protein [Microviridae sp.]
MLRNKTARQKNFAIIPSQHIQRSRLRLKQTRKQAFNASELIPIMCEEVLPGDTWQHTESVMARLATPIAPAVDDIDLETFYFFVPNRISWPDWEEFITGTNPSLTIPTIAAYDTGLPGYRLNTNSVFDHFGLIPQTYGAAAFKINVLPIWAYFEIYNQWFRDENLQTEWTWSAAWTYNTSEQITQGGTQWTQACLRLNKRHDYFTSSLPFAQKGTAVSIPLGTSAPVYTTTLTGFAPTIWTPGSANSKNLVNTNPVTVSADTGANGSIFADLSTATAATINSLRLAVTTQQLLELDARGGSRYVENLLAHWGVRSPDYRLQLPEYLGGSKLPVNVNPIAQTAAYTTVDGSSADSALGNLGAEMHASGTNRTFTYAATEHGYIIGLAAVRATPTYQQGTRRHWRRTTRLDYPDPIFANIGEQAVATQEIYQNVTNVPTTPTWGYQQRYAEMYYTPNEITGVLRSTYTTPLDWWHYAEKFAAEPALNAAFITDKTQETLARSLATDPSDQWQAQIIMDINHNSVVARLLPANPSPGLMRF